MKKNDRIDIVFGIDALYVNPLIVAAYSIIKNNTTFEEIFFHIITGGIPNEEQRTIRQLEKDFPGVSVDFAVVDEGLFGEFPLHIKHISPIAYGRFLAADLFGHLDRALYLDADVLILSDLSELWNTNVQNTCIAGSHKAYINRQFPGYKESIGLEKDSTYINSGVMLMNLYRIRMLGKTQELLVNAKKLKNIVRIQDQDIINITFREDIKRIHKKYNYTDSDRRERTLSDREVCIVHFNTRNKPWDSEFISDETNEFFSKEYLRYQNEIFTT
ncbi:glycosyltransferase family 8 protein [Candidatus Saccharibacteria bacterium]|nr:glycosyltransferase family 8 protein [Candidatus Saccharibacteria bacterium]